MLERLRQELNPAQLEAVLHDEGPLLVIAGAGSGKTRTLTYRAARLVWGGVPPEAILLLTFTRKAAREMLRRAALLLDARCEQIAGGTFHSFANTILRRHGSRIGLSPAFTIIDRADMEQLLGLLAKETGAQPRHGAFPRKRTLAEIFSKCANKVWSLEETLDRDYPHFRPYLEALADLRQAYTRQKQAQQLLDYDDLLLHLRDLLTGDPEACARVAGRYRSIMVDEYQDTNRIQAEIVFALARPHGNIMVVGDDSQSIYSFRGADFRNIMDFPRVFPQTRVITLEENYRSTAPILDLTNAIIAQAQEGYPKHLFTQHAQGPRPVLVHAGSENSQSRFVVDKVRELAAGGVPLEEIAVLFRAGYHSFDLELELTREDLPFVKYGGFKFIESAHIKDLLAHLRVAANPYDRVSWQRLLLLVPKVGPKGADKLYRAGVAAQGGLAGFLADPLPGAGGTGLKRLRELLAALADPEIPPARAGEAVLRYYLPILRETYDDHPRRARDLEQLLQMMERYPRLEPFLAEVTIEPPTAVADDALSLADDPAGRLVLSTVHSAKGLEWHTVFVIWALDGRFPSIHSLDAPEQLDEELRLMYVAATRARVNLFFLSPGHIFDRASGLVLNRPSRFLEGMAAGVLKRESAEIW
jgi:DNA helicase-2/ATP-dependent DNA helicase PcrA